MMLTFVETRDVSSIRGNNRFVSDAGGTIWDTVMAVTANGEVTELEMTMDARPYKLMAHIVNIVIKGMVTKAVTKDMDRLKMWCETQ